MKTLLYLAFIQFAFLPSGKNLNLQSELLQMRAADQKIINDQKKPQDCNGLPDSMQQSYRTRLWQIFRTYGYPDYDLVDTTGADAFWLLVQHQDMDTILQKTVLEAMQGKVKQGKASKLYVAFLTDRVMVNTGHAQVYGTQMRLGKNGEHEPKPIAKPAEVDSLRRSVGLEPLAQYIEFMNTFHLDSAGNLYYGKKKTNTGQK